MTSKYENIAKVGDRIRAWDFERMEGRRDRYVEGLVIETNSDYFVIECDKDTCSVTKDGSRVGIEIWVPVETQEERGGFRDDVRIELLETVRVVHSAFGETPRVVAEVYVPSTQSVEQQLESVFRLTNSIDSPWWENDEVNPLRENWELAEGCRSTSVGDMALVRENGRDETYVCVKIGWKNLYELARGRC